MDMLPKEVKTHNFDELLKDEPERIEVTMEQLWMMYQAQCQCTDEWADKYREEVKRKSPAELEARVKESLEIACNANALVGKERDRVYRLTAELAAARKDVERLDWMANNPAWTLRWRVHKGVMQWGCRDDGEPWGAWNFSYRDAIDQIIESQKPAPPPLR